MYSGNLPQETYRVSRTGNALHVGSADGGCFSPSPSGVGSIIVVQLHFTFVYWFEIIKEDILKGQGRD